MAVFRHLLPQMGDDKLAADVAAVGLRWKDVPVANRASLILIEHLLSTLPGNSSADDAAQVLALGGFPVPADILATAKLVHAELFEDDGRSTTASSE